MKKKLLFLVMGLCGIIGLFFAVVELTSIGWKQSLRTVERLNEEYIASYFNADDYEYETDVTLRKRALEASKQKLIIFQSLLQQNNIFYSQYKDALTETFGNVYQVDSKTESKGIELWECCSESSLYIGLDNQHIRYSYFLRDSTSRSVQVQCLQYAGMSIYSEYYVLEYGEYEYLVLNGYVPQIGAVKNGIEIWQKVDGIYVPVEFSHEKNIADIEFEYEGADDNLGEYFFREAEGTDLYSFNNVIMFPTFVEAVYDEQENLLYLDTPNGKLQFVFGDNAVYVK